MTGEHPGIQKDTFSISTLISYLLTMAFGFFRRRKIHSLFLESCRNLREGRTFWQGTGPIKRWLLQTLSPVPLISLHGSGAQILEALDRLETHCRTQCLREASIREYHRILYARNTEAGEYRRAGMIVSGSAVRRPPPDKLRYHMQQLDAKLVEEQARLDGITPLDAQEVLLFAVRTHQRIAYIHPFPDGNGRVARLAMNHILRRYGMGYVILPPVDESKEHFDALEAAHRGNLDALIDLAKRHLVHA